MKRRRASLTQQLIQCALATVLLAAASCDPWRGCDHDDVAVSLQLILQEHPELDYVVDRMDIVCTDDVRGACGTNVPVAACTHGIGSALAPGKTFIDTDFPIGNALAHEAQHWWQFHLRSCTDHTPECHWDAYAVERMQPGQ